MSQSAEPPTPPVTGPGRVPARWWANRAIRSWGLRVAALAALFAVLYVEALHFAPAIRQARGALAHLRWWWVVLAVWVEVVSMITFARLQRIMLAVGGVRVHLFRVFAVTMAANAMSVTLPGGAIISSGYTYKRMRSWGASSPLIAFGLVSSGFLSAVALTGLGVFGVTFADDHPNVPLLVLEIVGAVALAAAVRWVIRRPQLLLRFSERALGAVNRRRHRSATSGLERVHELLDELARIRPRRRDWARGGWFAVINWVADLACLVFCCRAVGASGPTIGVAIVAYTAGMAASSIPILPGGLGVVDAALIVALVHGNVSVGLATAGVLLYRLISFAMIVCIGWMIWLLIRRSDPPAARLEATAAARLESTAAAGYASVPSRAADVVVDTQVLPAS